MSNCGDKSDAATASTMDSYQDKICTSQTNQRNYNYYNILEEPHQDMINTCTAEAPRIKIPNNVGISDAGATGTFVVPGAPVINVRPTKNPLKITLPHGGIIESTHECNLDIPWLPEATTEAQIVPGLACASLISIKQMGDNGCSVIMNVEYITKKNSF